MVYPTGGAGNVYIGAGFAHSRRATFNVSVATFNTEVLAAQNGTEVVTGSHEITHYDVIRPVGGQYFTKFTALGTADAEIGFAYTVRDDGTFDKEYVQAATAGTSQFTYSSATKEITFGADGPAAGEWVAVAYTWATASNAQQITVRADGVPPVVLVSAYGIARDVCTGELFHCVLEGQAQVDGNWSFDVSADGEPIIQNLSMEFVKGCLTNDLYTFTVYTEDELGDENRVDIPVASPAGGSITTATTITLSSATPGSSIYYTVDGTIPTASSTLYSGPFTLTAGTVVVNAIAIAPGMDDSKVLSETYTVAGSTTQAAIPVATPPGGNYGAAQSVSLASATSGATIYYTDDGSTPTSASNVFTTGTPISVPAAATTNIKAIAIATGYTDSPIMDETYIIS